MAGKWPKILSRQTTTISPWVKIVAREVEFASGEPSQIYHAVDQQDYLAIVAITPDGCIPLVHQYRPAMEDFTWELPAGLVDAGEAPEQGCARELLEETGYPTASVHRLGGPAAACTGRLSNLVHSFFVKTGERVPDFKSEPGLTVALKTPAELAAMIASGEFIQQLHLGALMLAQLQNLLTLPR
jgi:8-oxo-dGTP pyrophosphatase MutT (NUDIX family)